MNRYFEVAKLSRFPAVSLPQNPIFFSDLAASAFFSCVMGTNYFLSSVLFLWRGACHLITLSCDVVLERSKEYPL